MHNPPTSSAASTSTSSTSNSRTGPQTRQSVYDGRPQEPEKLRELKEAYDAQIRVQLNHTHQKLGNEVSQIGRRKKSKLDQAETMSNSPPPAFENGVGSPGGGSASSIDARVSNATNTFKKTFSTTSGKSRFEGIEGYGSGSTSSYPFPQMTATRGAINAMSPSGGGPQDKPLPSGSATPSSFAFMPPGTDPPTPFENSEFPTPNMYELALTLHSEPGLEAFWSNLVKIITNLYKAERVSLAVPTDSTDLENTPWGQKATYCKEEYDTLSLTYIGEGGVGDPETEETEGEDDGQDGVAIPEGNTQSGRSYGTSGMAGKDDSKGYSSAEECNNLSLPLGSSPDLPFSPIVIGMSGTKQKYESSSSDWISEGSNVSPLRSPRSPNGSSEREEDYEQNQVRPSIDDEDQLKGRIFPILQPLSYEADALLDGAGVIRVLQRGKTVVLSREYRDIQSHLERKISAAGREKRRRDMQWSTITQQSDSIRDKGKREQLHIPLNDLPPPSPGRPPSEPPTPLPFVSKGVRRKGKKNGWKNDFVSNPVLQFYSSQQHQQRHSRSHSPSQSLYEEYEQPLSSPWSQSPAPSPAIKPDPSENPFFMPPRVDEDTFNPTSSSPIYSAQEPVHAIGLENASTVIHIPLVHPSISRLFRSNPAQTPSVHETGDRRNQTGKGTSNPSSKKAFTNGFLGSLSQGQANERRSPIAILSILSPVIPYPSNLVHSLSHFAPLVATALALAQAHDHLQTQLTHYRGRNRRRKHSQMNSYIPGHTSMLSPSFRSSSITSPSDHSTISRYSNTASLVTSPNSDAGNLHIHPVSTNSPDTPEQKMGGSGGNVDSYFMAKRRVLPRKQSGLYTPGQGPAHPRHSPSNINAVCNGQPSPSLEVQLQQEEDSGADSGTTIRDRTWEKVTLVSQSTSQGSLPNSDESIAPDDMTKMEQHLGVQGTNALLKTPSPDSESTPRPVSEFGYLRPKRPSLRRKMSLRRSTHTVLHSYGADYTATFQTLAATSTESGAHRPRLGLSSPRPFAMHEMPPPSNKLLRTIIDSIPVHVFTAAPYTGIPVWVNARLLAYQGVTVDEFTRSPWSALHPEDRDEYRRLWKMAVEAGLPFSHQMRIRRFDGVYRWFMNRAVPLRDSKGGIVHWFGTNMDIHDQRLAEVNAARQQEMAESEHKYRSLANSSPQIVFAATADEGITFANTQWQAYSGQTLERTLNLGFMEFVHPHDRYKCSLPGLGEGSHPLPIVSPKAEVKSPGLRAKLEARRLKLSEQGVPDTLSDSTFSTELRLRRKDGEYRWHLVRCVRVESNFGTGEGQWFGTCTDINDHKLLEQRLKETNEAAQKTMESKTRFLANMSHEIRTPLIGISGMVNFLLDTPLNGEQLDYCHTISQSSDGLLTVINDILDLSKVEAGMMRLNSTWFRIHSLIEDANELLSTMAIQKHLELNYIVEEDVPTVVGGDRIRLRQVLLNVIGNAIKFTVAGEVFSRCSVIRDAEVGEDEIMLKFECHDTGPGFDKKEEELIFKPFSQIDGSSTRAHGGSGLGLVISRQLVELHGGKMTAASVKGQGSTFVFSAVFKLPPVRETSDASSPISMENMDEDHILDKGFSSTDSVSRSSPGLSFTDGGVDSVGGSPIPPESSLVQFDTVPEGSPLHTLDLQEPQDPATMRFSLPTEAREKLSSYSPLYRVGSLLESPAPISKKSSVDSALGRALVPPIFSLLIVSEHRYSRIAIAHHIKMTLPKTIPNQITTASKFDQCMGMLVGENLVAFTHLVINLPDHAEIIALLSQILNSKFHTTTTVIVLTNPHQHKLIKEGAPDEHQKLKATGRLQFVYKPIKPSRFGVIFDPENERDASTDRNRDSAQQVVESQKRVFSEMRQDVGSRGHRVLLVEDNIVNQKVLLRFLSKVGLEVETASDGEECVIKVFSSGSGYYSLILCDLHMPRKDGFQACAEIRQWEKGRRYKPVPIIALSADVVSGVASRCAQAGFSRYVSKPVDFAALSTAIKELLDPTKTHDLMGLPSQSSSSPKNLAG